MENKYVVLIGDCIRKTVDLFRRIISRIDHFANPSRLIKKGSDRSLYRTRCGDLYWLSSKGYVDRCIIDFGIFEPSSTKVVKSLVKEGNIVLDVGANIGYYSVILSKLVGKQGKVICFEPTDRFGKVLRQNIEANNLQNIELIKSGLSDKAQELDIQICEDSATLHLSGNNVPESSEKIKLITLDSFLKDHPLPRIDFIKIDVDGHEPLFLSGAENTLNKYEPIILLEVSHPHYLSAGYTAWDFYDMLKDKRYYIYFEDGLVEIKSKEDFLVKCGNFAYSANVVISRKRLLV